ncbi:hypothetical protein RJT34_23351 [Clitoria ternatea]|uniref:Uncharacterized protein n=1 Tax=Clitoria ternatea TaxID=43366 RepID=A0AAN9FKY7_CLITE
MLIFLESLNSFHDLEVRAYQIRVMKTLPSYTMQSTLVPVLVCNALDKLRPGNGHLTFGGVSTRCGVKLNQVAFGHWGAMVLSNSGIRRVGKIQKVWSVNDGLHGLRCVPNTMLIRWENPLEMWVKLNSDGSLVRLGGVVTFKGLLRDH